MDSIQQQQHRRKLRKDRKQFYIDQKRKVALTFDAYVTIAHWKTIEEGIKKHFTRVVANIVLDFAAVDVQTDFGTYVNRCRPVPKAPDDDHISWAEWLYEATEDYVNDMESSLTTRALHIQFEGWYGAHDAATVNTWTKDTVYFTICHDGHQSLGNVSRHPVGGGSEIYVE